MNVNDNFDPWTQFSVASQPDGQTLTIEIIEGVEPLGEQFGVDVPKTVPDMLYETFFGQPEPVETEIAAAGEYSASVPPMHTFAILDAAKVTNLPELLETSGLENRCLFKGNAYDNLKDLAPWVVRLEDGNNFTRNLFTRSDALRHLWDSEPGIYLRSRGTLDEIWRHFRKFTKMQDGRGKWYYLRLHDAKTMVYYLNGVRASQARVQQIFRPNMGSPIDIILAVSVKAGSVTAMRSLIGNETEKKYQNTQGQDGETFELDARYTEEFFEASIALVRKYAPELGHKTKSELMRLARKSIPGFYEFGLVSKPAVANALAIIALCDHSLSGLAGHEQNLLRDERRSQFLRTSILLQRIKNRVLV